MQQDATDTEKAATEAARQDLEKEEKVEQDDDLFWMQCPRWPSRDTGQAAWVVTGRTGAQVSFS